MFSAISHLLFYSKGIARNVPVRRHYTAGYYDYKGNKTLRRPLGYGGQALRWFDTPTPSTPSITLRAGLRSGQACSVQASSPQASSGQALRRPSGYGGQASGLNGVCFTFIGKESGTAIPSTTLRTGLAVFSRAGSPCHIV